MKSSCKKLCAAAMCVAVVAVGAVEAASLKLKNIPWYGFPGIDEEGEPCGAYCGLVKASLNLKNGRATITGRATVKNDSDRLAVFRDTGCLGIGELISDRYVVTRKGKATYSGSYEDVSPECLLELFLGSSM